MCVCVSYRHQRPLTECWCVNGMDLCRVQAPITSIQPSIRVQARICPLTRRPADTGYPHQEREREKENGHDTDQVALPQHAHQPALSKDITAPFHPFSYGRLSLLRLQEPREVIAGELWALISTSWSTGCQAECGNLAQR